MTDHYEAIIGLTAAVLQFIAAIATPFLSAWAAQRVARRRRRPPE